MKVCLSKKQLQRTAMASTIVLLPQAVYRADNAAELERSMSKSYGR